MIGRFPTANGLARVAEPAAMLMVKLTPDEIRLLADAVERQSITAEATGDVGRADRQAGRAHDLRQKLRNPVPAPMPLHRPMLARAALIARTWPAGAAA